MSFMSGQSSTIQITDIPCQADLSSSTVIEIEEVQAPRVKCSSHDIVEIFPVKDENLLAYHDIIEVGASQVTQECKEEVKREKNTKRSKSTSEIKKKRKKQ